MQHILLHVKPTLIYEQNQIFLDTLSLFLHIRIRFWQHNLCIHAHEFNYLLRVLKCNNWIHILLLVKYPVKVYKGKCHYKHYSYIYRLWKRIYISEQNFAVRRAFFRNDETPKYLKYHFYEKCFNIAHC
jgi:hypothetical protein